MDRKIVIYSLLISVAVWASCSWPLARHMRTAIPFSGHQRGEQVQHMVPGDHLQLLFHFWLASDMIRGETPPYYYLYEFNLGDDAERYHMNPMFYPFSLIYAVGERIGGHALGYNVNGLLSIWVTYLFTWLLTARYCPNWRLAGLAALPAILFPFRWHSLMGGSPSGLAVMWVPAVLLGMDIAVRESRKIGGVLAGCTLLYTVLSDQHTFFFSALALPVWFVIAAGAREDFQWRSRREWVRLFLALLPVPLLALVGYGISHADVTTRTGGTSGALRTLEATALFSPHAQHLFSRADSRFGSQVYLGTALIGLIVLGLLLLAWRVATAPRRPWRPFVLLVLCAVSIAGMGALALGVHGPGDGILLVAARKLIPPYTMVRQTAKIFCLIPTFFCVTSALALSALASMEKRRWLGISGGLLLLLVAAVEYRTRLQTAVCVLTTEQGAYQRVVADADARHETPRALAITLWPGDSAPSSLYQHYASLYRLRMANGYSPLLPAGYATNFFHRFECVNQGWLPSQTLDSLRGYGIRYLILHEDQFPEMVSPFPVTFTLAGLLNNSRLQLLGSADQTWSFRILDEPEERPVTGEHWTPVFPARRWEAEACASTNLLFSRDESASQNVYVTFDRKTSVLETPTNRVAAVTGLKYLARVRGSCALRADILLDGAVVETYPLFINSQDWVWLSIPVTLSGYRSLSLRLGNPEGLADMDMMLLMAGDWNPALPPGRSVTLPAPAFFHAGRIDLQKDSVFLVAHRRTGTMFYGPKLPIEPGNYAVELEYESPAPDGTELGEQIVNMGEDRPLARNRLIAGAPSTLRFTQPASLPFMYIFSFSGAADLHLKRVTLTRLEAP